MKTRYVVAVSLIMAATGILGTPACDVGCEETACDQYGGPASKTFQNCYTSGEGSVKDEFWLEDAAGKEFYRCERAADDNDSCGVELITAKEAYCTAGGDGSGSTTGAGAAGSTGAAGAGTP